MDTITAMRSFVAVAGQGSFTGAAKQLGISTNLVSKYVRQLEEHLGAQLFHRTTRSVSLTDTGLAYFDRCVPLLDQFDELESVVQEKQSELAGPIRITAPTGFGSSHLVTALEPFQRKHPKVSIDLYLSDQRLSVIREGFDLAIRFGVLEDSSLIARKLLDMRLVFFASPDYLEQAEELTSPEQLSNHNCLLPVYTSEPDQWTYHTDHGEQVVKVSSNFRANSPRAIAQMAAGGLGVGKAPLYAVQPFIDDGSLQLVLEDYEPEPIGLYAVYPPSRHLTARIRAVIDSLIESFIESYH